MRDGCSRLTAFLPGLVDDRPTGRLRRRGRTAAICARLSTCRGHHRGAFSLPASRAHPSTFRRRQPRERDARRPVHRDREGARHRVAVRMRLGLHRRGRVSPVGPDLDHRRRRVLRLLRRRASQRLGRGVGRARGLSAHPRLGSLACASERVKPYLAARITDEAASAGQVSPWAALVFGLIDTFRSSLVPG